MFLDIAVGILFALGIGELYFEQTPYWFVILGVVFSLLPDIDGVLWLLRPKVRSVWYTMHRKYTGYPLLYIIPAIFVFIIFGKEIGLLFSVCIFMHHLHDTFFIGWGVMWFWPFSKRKYKFFPDKDGSVTSTFMISWLPEEEGKIVRWSGGHNDGWIKRYFLRPNIVAYTEYGGLITASTVLFFYYH